MVPWVESSFSRGKVRVFRFVVCPRCPRVRLLQPRFAGFAHGLWLHPAVLDVVPQQGQKRLDFSQFGFRCHELVENAVAPLGAKTVWSFHVLASPKGRD